MLSFNFTEPQLSHLDIERTQDLTSLDFWLWGITKHNFPFLCPSIPLLLFFFLSRNQATADFLSPTMTNFLLLWWMNPAMTRNRPAQSIWASLVLSLTSLLRLPRTHITLALTCGLQNTALRYFASFHHQVVLTSCFALRWKNVPSYYNSTRGCEIILPWGLASLTTSQLPGVFIRSLSRSGGWRPLIFLPLSGRVHQLSSKRWLSW